jgi:hypothetical protein
MFIHFAQAASGNGVLIPHTWIDVALIAIPTIPAVIAAFQSRKNGQEQTRVREELAKTNGHLLRVRNRTRVPRARRR